MSWTDPDDVTDSWIPADDAPTDTALIQSWIDRAERYLRSKIPTLSARIDDAEEDLLEKTIDVVSAMVQRLFRNPDGTRQRQETTGPFTESMTFGGDQPGSLWLTDDELQLLAGVSTGRHTAFSIDLLPADYVYPGPEDNPWADA
jgi:hypothetical protein